MRRILQTAVQRLDERSLPRAPDAESQTDVALVSAASTAETQNVRFTVIINTFVILKQICFPARVDVLERLMSKTYVITGASSGSGPRSRAHGPGRRQRRPRRAQRRTSSRSSPSACGSNALDVKTDVTDPEAVRSDGESRRRSLRRHRRARRNAGISMWARFREITDLSLFERIMRVNYLEPCIRTLRAAALARVARAHLASRR